MKGKIFKVIYPKGDPMKAILDKKSFVVSSGNGDAYILKFVDTIDLTVEGEEQKFYIMNGGGDEDDYTAFQEIEDGGVAALLFLDLGIEEEVLRKYAELRREKINNDDGESTEDKRQNEDLRDIIFNPNNKEQILLGDEYGREIRFDQIALIFFEKNGEIEPFVLLKPLDKIEGIEDDNTAIVFIMDTDANGNTILRVEEDEDVMLAVFNEYNELVKAHGVKIPDED